MVTIVPAKESLGTSIGKGIANLITTGSEAYQNRADEAALQKSISDLGPNASARDILNAITNTQTYSKESKQNLFKNYLGAEEFEEVKRRSRAQEDIAEEKNRISTLGKKGQSDVEALKQNYRELGMPEYEIDLLVNPDVTPATKQEISKQHSMLVSRGLRQPIPEKPTETSQEAISNDDAGMPTDQTNEVNQGQEKPIPVEEAISPEQEAIETQVVKPAIKKDEWPELTAPQETTPAERVKWRDKNQTFNNKLLKETKEKTSAHKDSLLKYGRARDLNDSGKLPSGIGRLVINPETGDPRPIASLVGVVNKETQNFVKTINDFLSGAQKYFGGKVSNFEVGTFKSRLPSLMNTEEGRRLIIEQMRLMEELQLVHDQELEDGLKHYGSNASYSDIQKVVDEKVEDKEQAIISKINNLDQASDYLDLMANNPKFKDTTLMKSKEGKFKAVPNSKVNEAKSKGYIAW